MDFTLEQFAVATGSTHANASLYYEAAVQACARFKIDEDAERLAAFFGSVAVETECLTAMQESLYYRDAERLARLFLRVFDEDHNRIITSDEIDKARPYCRMPKELSLKLYGGYHGRGGLMLTWEKNYRVHSDKLGTDYLHNPDRVLEPEHTMLSAASFWDETNCNDVAHDMGEVTLRVNGPARLALARRIAQRNEAFKVLA